MKIGISCKGTNSSYKGGVNTYIFGLLDGFLNVGNGHEFQIYISKSEENLYGKYLSNGNFELIKISNNDEHSKILRIFRRIAREFSSFSLYKYLSDILLKEVVAQMEKHSDIMYFPRTILYPYSFNIPTVVSIHDIQQFHYPQFFTRRELKKRKITYGLTAKYSNFIQASSFFIQDDLLKHYPMLNRDQIPVIPEGVNRSTFERKIDFSKIRSKFNLDFQYLFFPAQLWPHKNHMTILKALKHLETEYGKKIHLVLTGARYKNSNVIFKYIDDNEMDYVHYLGKVELEELIGLYQNAKFMITGVLYESSSLPILESAASGTPIIASKTPPNQEMAKVLKINMFDPLDCLELSSLIMNIWGNDEKREDQIVNNLKNINQYSWEIAAEKYIEFFKKCIR